MQVTKAVLALALGWMVLAPVWAADAPVDAAPTVKLTAQGEFLQQVREAGRAFDRGDMQAADQAFKALVADKRLAALSDEERQGVLLLAGTAAFNRQDAARARGLLERVLQIGPNGIASYLMSVLHLVGGEGDLAARDLAVGLRLAPEMLASFDDELPLDVLRTATRGSPERLELMQALFDSGWDRQGLGLNWVWFQLAEAHVQLGHQEQAKAALARIDGAMTLVRVRSDKRFDALVASLPDLPTPEAAAKARVERLRTLVREQPRRLETVHTLISALLVVGEWDEALRLTDDALARIQAAPADAPVFDDQDRLSWLKDLRSRELRALGRTDEALEEMKAAAATPERSQANVSQVLNLGHFYCQLARPDDALAAIEQVGDAISGYGRIVEGSIRVCAAAQKRDERGVKRALRDVRQYRSDGASAYLDALVLAGQQDAAAKELIAQLGDNLLRAEALIVAQTFLEPNALPGEVEYRSDRNRVLAREDVHAAIRNVGRTGTYAIYSGWDDE